uniref:Putative retrotransposon n=1 Tax=Phaseolus vulgaris TaxID=3885 RepID=I7B2F5_PHAVU|nr:putative retrotransposon [Phaseolus vulgaris]
MEFPVVGKKFMWFKSNGSAKMKSLVKDWSPKPFRTIDAWLMERGFKDIVKDKWMPYAVHGNGISKHKDKLKMLKADLKVWNYEVFGHLNSNKESILKEIEDLDCQDANGVLEKNARSKRMELIGMLAVTNKKIDSLISPKARGSWYKGSSILCLDGEDLEMRLKDNLSLIVDFSKEEIWEAVWQCDWNKSPEPDGYNFNFIKKSWDVMKGKIVAVVRHFQELGNIPKGSFIALVPKVRDPLRLDQYRPISLVGELYKIISKVLSSRINCVLPSVIDESKSAFLKDKGMLDSVY